MSDVLAAICDRKRAHVAAREVQRPRAELERALAEAPAPRGFLDALERTVAAGRHALIAEIKKASPSRGLIRADFDPPALARAYAEGGATCLSVLTDQPYFQGDDRYLRLARDAVDLPVLRKDFILDPYQVLESRILGADCLLLIMAALDDSTARTLHTLGRDLGMDVLIEVHDGAELDRALVLEPALIGINNRNLKTLEVDLGNTERLAGRVPDGIRLVAESGLHGPGDLDQLAAAGARCFLVGESLMREADVRAATERLLGLVPAG